MAIFPLLENIVMLQHATQFSFDRLKFVVPLVLALGLALSMIKNNLVLMLFGFLIIFSSAYSVSSYERHLEKHTSWQTVHSQNYDLFERVQNHISGLEEKPPSCLKFASNISVRGYANLMVGRGIYEGKSESWLYLNKGECLGVYLQATNVFSDLPKYHSISLIDQDGKITKFEPLKEPTLAVIDLKGIFITDNNWENGIGRHWAGFFVPSSVENLSKFKTGAIVVFKDSSEREVIDTKLNGQYLNVYVEGEILNHERVGLPLNFKIK